MFKEFFYLQKNDRQALLVILLVIAIALILIFYIGGKNTQTSLSLKDSLQRQEREEMESRRWKADRYGSLPENRVELFPFDPNTADSTELRRLGLAPWQVRNLYRYRANGGLFRKPSDFARLYGLTRKQYRMMEPFIRISEEYAPASGLFPTHSSEDQTFRDTLRYPVKLREGEQISLNASDTSELRRIPGIGSAYARAIAAYRDRLGGFYSVQQIEEIEGVPPEAKKYLKVTSSEVRKLKVNRLNVNQLRKHPYINFYQARDIYDFRRLHGPLKSIRQLANDRDFPPAALERLEPYLDYD